MLRLSSALAACLVAGCSLFGHVAVEPVATSFQRPSNVAAYLAVSDGEEPVTELAPENFKIYEDHQLLAAEDTRQTLLAKELVASHQTLLVVDVGGKSAASAPDTLARAVASFVESARRSQAVSVFAFDGSAGLRSVGEFPKAADGSSVELKALSKLQLGDTSRNLNGAVLAGLKELDARLAASRKSIKVGTLVVFTRGPDLAGRVSAADLERALDATNDQVVALGVGESAERELGSIGKSGSVRAANADALGVMFEQAAAKVRALYDKYYLVQYCSPARGGTRQLRIEVNYRNVKGDDKHGSYSEEFSAAGFGPGCNPQALPRFAPKPVAPKSEGRGPVRAVPAAGGEAKPDAPSEDQPVLPPAEDDGSVAPPPNKPGYSQ